MEIPPWRCSVLYQGKKVRQNSAGLLDPRKATGEAGVVLQGLELRLGEWGVITDLRTAVSSNAIESLCSAIGSHLPPPYSNSKGCWCLVSQESDVGWGVE